MRSGSAGLGARHRRWHVLRGTEAETRARALDVCADLPADSILWVADAAPLSGAVCVRPTAVKRLLGRSFDAVVIDVHTSLDPDLVGRCHGFVWGGGALILRMPPAGQPAVTEQGKLAAFPYGPEDVGLRFYAHFESRLGATPTCPLEPLRPACHEVLGSSEQEALVATLERRFAEPVPQIVALVADRGRGKSSALGMVVGRLIRRDEIRVIVSAGHVDAASEVMRFAEVEMGDGIGSQLRFVPISVLADGELQADLIIIDEAAQLPVAMLQRVVVRYGGAHLAFATTTRGYEGTGRGFVLRFLSWLAGRERPSEVMHLTEPIRWAAGDPLERLVFDALLLDAQPTDPAADFDPEAVVHRCLDRDELVEDLGLLRSFFGLLIHAHYRTTPGDLRSMLDAPNIRLHALLAGGQVVAATMVALEGGLPPALCDEMADGKARIRAHALADTLVAHLGHRDAGRLRMVRSVRIAVHPRLRRLGLATRLVEHVHRTYSPDLFGTLFGVTVGLLAFRRSVGYELVRVSASRGARTGEPAAMMVRPVSDPARALMATLRRELARDLPLQVDLLRADRELVLEEDLRASLAAGLGTPAPLDVAECTALARMYAYGPRTFESVAFAVACYVEAHPAALAALPRSERAVLEGRALARRSWAEVTADAGLGSVRVSMRALRRAVRAMLEVSPGP